MIVRKWVPDRKPRPGTHSRPRRYCMAAAASAGGAAAGAAVAAACGAGGIPADRGAVAAIAAAGGAAGAGGRATAVTAVGRGRGAAGGRARRIATGATVATGLLGESRRTQRSHGQGCCQPHCGGTTSDVWHVPFPLFAYDLARTR